MKNYFSFLTVLLVFIFSGSSQAQQISLTGRITDASNGEAIPFASIAIAGTYRGTSSNIEGEFIIKVDSIPVNLIFSHISYKDQEIRVENSSFLPVQLEPGETILEEVVIEDREKGEYAYNLLLRAFGEAIRHSRDWKYALAYYRQTSKNKKDYSELYEIFYDTRYSSQGIVDWAIQEGRYAMNTGSEAADFVFNKNFTLLTRLVTMYQPETDKFVMPVNEKVRELYLVDVKSLQNIEDRTVAVIEFTPKEDLIVPAMEGEIFIDIDTYEILKLHGYIRNDNFDMIALTNPEGTWKDYVLEIEAAYKPAENKLFLDYISLKQTFDYYLEDQYSHKVETNSFLTCYEHYQPEKFKRLGGRLLRSSRSDREILDKVGYNKRFWEQNPLVKRTTMEKEIIGSFEAVNAFGSIYLNDRDEIQLEKDNLSQDPFIQQIKLDLRLSKMASLGEKVYLHRDKPFYASGETIWFNAFIVNLATHIPSPESGVLYVDLISPEGEILENLRLNIADAYADGNFTIPKKSKTGRYRLRAYTQWMKNYDEDFFYDEAVNIYNASEVLIGTNYMGSETIDYAIDFFPEGGNLVNGIPSQVAFKATDPAGGGIDISGKVVDEEGNQVVEFTTRHDGMGSFFLIPQTGKKLRAKVRYEGVEKTFPLPEPEPEGYVMSVNNLRNKNIQLIIKTSPSFDNTELYIIGQSRGVLYHREKIRINRRNAIVSIPKSKLPDGIFQITIFDAWHTPRCERVVFIDNKSEMDIDIAKEYEALKPREQIELKLNFKDEFGKAIRNTRFSIAITDAEHLEKKPGRNTIRTSLLLTSDIKGRIDDPGYYFMDDDRDTKISLDLVMLTHGWRRFSWKEIFDRKFSNTDYSHESGINITGKAYIENTGNPLQNGYINIISVDDSFPAYWTTTTDLHGNFSFRGLDIPDTLRVITKSLNDKGKPVNIDIELNSLNPWPAKPVDFQSPEAPVDEEVHRYLNLIEEKQRIMEAYDFSDRIVLKEIEIRGERYDNELYGQPDNVIVVDETLRNFSDIFQLIQGRVPGVMLSGQGLNTRINIRGVGTNREYTSDQPLFIVDGVPINNLDPSTARTLNEADTLAGDNGNNVSDVSNVNSVLMSINPQDVDRIEVLKNASSTGAFGMRGANGVILIYTRRGPVQRENTRSKGYEAMQLPGYSLVREFYSPEYDTGDENYIPDKRTTLYWDPSVFTDNLGNTKISFFNSDDANRIQIEIEGVTDYGEAVNHTQIIGSTLVK